MNKQRKVLITITYNEMGIIIDTKAEEVVQPNLQPTCNQLATDCISRQAAIDVVKGIDSYFVKYIEELPSTEPEIIRCKDCKYFEYDRPYVIQGVPVLGHLVCSKWGDGCRTEENGFCFMAERRTDE